MRVPPAERRLRIAFVYSRIPFPMVRGGDTLTVAHLLAFLAARGHAVDFFTLDNGEPITAEQRAWLDRVCARVHIDRQGIWRSLSGILRGLAHGHPLQVGWYDSPAQKRAVRAAIERGGYDVAYCYYLRSAEALRFLGGTRGPGAGGPVSFLALQLSQSLNTRRIVEHAKSLRDRRIYGLEAKLIRRYEARVWADFSRTVLIGPKDLDEIRTACREQGVAEIDNHLFCAHGVDIDRFAPRHVAADPSTVIFSGVMKTNTNVSAILWFVGKVWPRIKAEVPSARLLIVGRDPRKEIRDLAMHDAIEVTGEVADPADFIAQAAVCVNPVSAGAGMQNKLLEYMAMGKPTVATSVANEGIDAPADECLLLADTPQEFAAKVVMLLRDPERRAELGANARRFVERHWTWEAHFLRLEAAMLDALHQSG